MQDQSKAAREIALVALALGILGDMLLRATPWGLNVGLWVGMLLVAFFVLIRRHAIAITTGGGAMPLVMFLFALMPAWRDSPVLLCLNTVAVLTALTLAVLRGRVGQLSISEIFEYPTRAFLVGVSAILGVVPLLHRDTIAPTYGPPVPLGNLRQAALGRGLILTTPLVLVFGALLMGADPIFDHEVRALFDWNVTAVVEHCLWVFVCGALGAGVLRTLLIRTWPLPESAPARPMTITRGVTETTMILSALNALFLAFVVVQFRYFFGGAQFVHQTIGMAYAQYARSGFFQLVWVTLLVLPLLLALHGVLKAAPSQDRLWFRRLAAALVLLLFVIMASAMQRMMLYAHVYGLTELRVYTTAFMGWLALVFVWFLTTILRERHLRFTYGAIVAGFGVIALLNIIDPDGLIVRVNLGRAFQGQSFDAAYNADSLGADAVPELVAALPRLPPDLQKRVATGLLFERRELASDDWRNANYSRAAARRALRNRANLERRAGCSVESGGFGPPCKSDDDED